MSVIEKLELQRIAQENAGHVEPEADVILNSQWTIEESEHIISATVPAAVSYTHLTLPTIYSV